ncbi:MAG: DUF3604 domain-containing protein [Anaerolineae bacterium]|nr:DUF3604 domain-containing protein [Anaerolineae bacterium]
MASGAQHAGQGRPRSWTQNEWYVQNSLWRTSPAAPGSASIEPSVAEAYSGHHWVVTYAAGDEPLRPGSHLAIEIPAGWTPHLGRPLHGGRQILVPAGVVNPGYSAWARVEGGQGTRFELSVSDCTRFQVLDAVLVEGEVPPGRQVRIYIGTEDGSQLRCPWFAQDSPLAMGIDFNGDGVYLPVSPPPTVTVTGAGAAALRAIAPATVQPGERFPLTVQAIDQYGANLAARYQGQVELETSGPMEEVSDKVDLLPQDGSQKRIPAKAREAGVAIIRAFDRQKALSGRSNPIGVGFCDPGQRILFGDLHGQVYVSIGTGTLDEYYTWAREVERLDFCAPANHYGGRMDFDNLPDWETERHEALHALWADDVAKSNRYYAPGEFVTLVSFECGVGRYGHKNVYYRGDSGIYIRGQDGLTPDELWGRLDEEGYRALTIPHHPKFCGPTDWSFRNDKFQRLVEICSAWGISEASGPHSVRAALAMGHRLGFVGGTDTHFGQPGRPPHFFGEGGGLAGVYVPELTREALWDALHDRRCYATTGARILLRMEVNGAFMGSEIEADEVRVSAHVVGTVPDFEVDVIRNGSVVHSVGATGYEHWLEWNDREPKGGQETNAEPVSYYYVRVRQPDRHQAWSSPVWVS